MSCFNNLHPPRAVFPKAEEVTDAGIRQTLGHKLSDTWQLLFMSRSASLRMRCYELHVSVSLSILRKNHRFAIVTMVGAVLIVDVVDEYF